MIVVLSIRVVESNSGKKNSRNFFCGGGGLRTKRFLIAS